MAISNVELIPGQIVTQAQWDTLSKKSLSNRRVLVITEQPLLYYGNSIALTSMVLAGMKPQSFMLQQF